MSNLIEQLRRDEGLNLKPYKDSLGYLSIGIGRNLDANGISLEEAEVLLATDVARAEKLLAERLPWTVNLDEVRRGALLNMCFNMGIGGLLQFRRTLGLIQVGQYEQASKEMLNSVWATQVKDRAKRLSEQIRTGEWK